MVVYNASSREVTAKIVYYGPGLSGKTTNLQFLHRKLEPSAVGQLLTLAATSDRTIFFDLLPVELGDLKGYRIRFQVATVPGQTPYNETRKLVLKGVDGLVFVVDSRWSMLPKNLESFQNLKANVEAEGLTFDSIPIVVQYNKRDLPDVLNIDALQEGLGLAKFPAVEATATEGRGVVETFKLISKLTFVDILKRLQKRKDVRSIREDDDTSRMSTWKNTMLHSAGAAPAHAEAASVAADDSSLTVAIRLPPAGLVAPSASESGTALESPFGDDTIAAPAGPGRPEPEPTPPRPASSGISEDTNPAFFPPPASPAPPKEPASNVVTASFRRPSVAEPTSEKRPAARLDDTAPHAIEASLPAPAGFVEPKREERVASIDAVDLLSARIEGLETKLAQQMETLKKSDDDVRRDAANVRFSLESNMKELSGLLATARQELSEIGSREMEIVAQVSRESLTIQAAAEKLGFRVGETENRLSELAVTHESRISNIERLVHDSNVRAAASEDAIRGIAERVSRIGDVGATVRRELASLLAEFVERLRGGDNPPR